MRYVLHSITMRELGTYDVAVRDHESSLTFQCTITKDGGIQGVQPEPDVFMTGQVFARDIAGPVLMFHQSVEATLAREEPLPGHGP